MKLFNTIATLGMTAFVVLALGACSKTNNDSPAPAPYAYGYGTQTVCPAVGYYPINGQNVPCTPGQMVGGTGYGTYPYPQAQTQASGCTSYYYQYGVQYVPMYMSGQLVCVNYNWLLSTMQTQGGYQAYQSTPYAMYGAQYYYSYPPYSAGYGGYSSCNSQINLGYATGGAAVGGSFCF